MLSQTIAIHREVVFGSQDTDGAFAAGFTPAVGAYLAHTHAGYGIRAIAREKNCEPSTVLRQIRKIEERREDPLVDAALDHVAKTISPDFFLKPPKESSPRMSVSSCAPKPAREDIDDKILREARRILRRLCEKDAFLAVAEDMDKAVVLRETIPGRPTRTAVVDRDIAYHFALQDWISCASNARICRYEVTEAGRSALKRLLEEERQTRSTEAKTYAEAPSPFRVQHQEFGERRMMDREGRAEEKIRYNLAESPLTVLGRKRGRDGAPFLQPYMIDAGERLREDFEMAQLCPRVAQNWDNFLTPRDSSPAPSAGAGGSTTSCNARDRFHGAMTALGPGLSDVVFRVCCFLEGLETAEKRLGWSARSGKVVLRIALQRLAMHYGMMPKASEVPVVAPQMAEAPVV